MAAIRHVAKRPKRNARPAGPKAASRAELDEMRAKIATSSSYAESIRLARRYLEKIEQSPPMLRPGEKSAWDKIVDSSKRIPRRELERQPRDGAANIDHYLYGVPKQDPD